MDQETANLPLEPTEAMIDAGLAATNAWLDIKGSALTVNREKMRRRYIAMVQAYLRMKEGVQS
jgi:hypothetical protein